MKIDRYPLSSDQLELLMAFQKAQGLGDLASSLGRDPSVVSRNLQRLAETLPVIEKHSGKWRITELGLGINAISERSLAAMAKLLQAAKVGPRKFTLPPNATLLVINAQKGLCNIREQRNNPSAESNMAKVLNAWRERGRPLIHVPHQSENPASAFHPSAESAQYIPGLAPQGDEMAFPKFKPSALEAEGLQKLLQEKSCEFLVLVGLTAADCIEATARQASAMGLQVLVVGDATATFDITGPDGKLHKAERVNELVLANLHALGMAKVMATSELLGIISF